MSDLTGYNDIILEDGAQRQITIDTPSSSGDNLEIKAGSGNGSGNDGGNLILSPGDAGSSNDENGLIQLNGIVEDLIAKGPIHDIRAYGAIENDSGAKSTNTIAIQNAINDGGIVFIPSGDWYIDDEIEVKSEVTIVGTNYKVNTPTNTKTSRIIYDGSTDDTIAILRVSNQPVGTPPTASVANVHISKILLDGQDKIGFGLYIAYGSVDSTYEKIAVQGCNKHGFFIIRALYQTYRDLVATYCNGCGITIGPNPTTLASAPFSGQGWGTSNWFVNGVLFENLRANACGRSFDTQNKWNQNSNKHEGYGIGFYPGAASTIHSAVCESNKGAGIVFQGRGVNCCITDFYGEANMSAESSIADYQYGIIFDGTADGRGNFAGNIYLHSAQSIWITGSSPAANKPFLLENVFDGNTIKASHSGYTVINSNPSIAYDGYKGTSAAIITDGKIGLGTTQPANLIDIIGGDFGQVHIKGSTNTQFGGIKLYNDSDKWGFIAVGGSSYAISACQNDLIISSYLNDLHLGTGNFTPKITILNNGGNVGIGTTNPVAKLDVRGSVIINEEGGDNDVRIEGDTDPNLLVTDASADKVGIGTNAPNEKLEISQGNIKISKLNSPKLLLYDTNNGWLSEVTVGDIGSTQGADFSIKTNNTNRLTVKSDGNVGIGTTDPQIKLDVNDDSIRIQSSKTPSSASDTGIQGQIAWDTNYIYVCTATDTWKRVALSTW